MSVDATNAPQVEPAKLIYWALDRGMLTPNQAMTCCLAMGELQGEGTLHDLEQFLLRQEWLTQEGYLDLLSTYSNNENPQAMDDIDPLAVLATIQQTMNEIDASWLAQTNDYDTPTGLGDLGVVSSIESHVSFDADGSLSVGGVSSQERKRSYTSPMGSPALVAPAGQTAELSSSPKGHSETPAPETKPSETSRAKQSTVSWVDMAAWDPATTGEARYLVGEELGRGGLGVVVEARDMRLGRKVARKSLLRQSGAGSEEVEAFIAEARLTGQLEHPNIMPIYDFGQADDGDLFYTMRLMPSNNLEQAKARGELSLIQFVKILQQVCMGLEYAHSRGVVHRDVKPANILLGQFGEVLILDWGIARVLEHTDQDGLSRMLNTKKLRGTPAYMAPELIKEGRISPAVDQYALGVMLYEFLSGRLPFLSENLYTLLFQICSEPVFPPQETKKGKAAPLELSQICMRMLEKDPANRFPSCRAVHDRLEEFLEGSRETKRRQEAASARIAEASQFAQEYHVSRALEADLFAAWEEAQRQIEPWESIEKKREVWQKEDEYKHLRERSVTLFGSAIQKFTQALEHEPGNAEARKGMADLYWSKFEEAERERDQLNQIQFRDLIMFYDDGTYAALFEGKGELQLDAQPGAANVALYRYEEQDRRLQPVLVSDAGVTPLTLELPMGSYLLKLTKDGYREVRLPIKVGRCQMLQRTVQMYTDDEIGDGYVYVPGGPFTFGGNPNAQLAIPASEVVVDDLFISRHPVTFGEYCEFLNDLHRQDPDQAEECVLRSSNQKFVVWEEEKGYVPCRESLFYGIIEKRYPPGEGHEERVPAFGMTLDAARHYCAWRSQREGRRVTLPTEQQWEKAAKGDDQRLYPWGSYFDASFCKMGSSRTGDELQPEPIGVFPSDCSPYGLCDVVGTVAEWCLPKELSSALDAPIDPELMAVFRGGGWVVANADSLQICNRVLRPAGRPSYNIGFRVVSYPDKGSR